MEWIKDLLNNRKAENNIGNSPNKWLTCSYEKLPSDYPGAIYTNHQLLLVGWSSLGTQETV